MLSCILLLFLFYSNSNQSCIQIEQIDEGNVNEETRLNCVLQEDTGGKDGSVSWYMRSPPSNPPVYLASVRILDGSVYVDPNYTDKVGASWDNPTDTFTLRIKNTSLSDDEAQTRWQCQAEIICSSTESHSITVKGRTETFLSSTGKGT